MSSPSLCSFGRDCLSPVSSRRRPSVRRALRAFLAARRRWPDGRLGWSWGLAWVCADGSAGLLLSGGCFSWPGAVAASLRGRMPSSWEF